MGTKGNKFTKNEYQVIKTLIGAGVKTKQIMAIVNRSEYIVQQAKKADTWEEYERNRDERTAQLRAKDPRIKANKRTESVFTHGETNEEKATTAIQSLADGINRLCDILEGDSEITKKAREFKIFGRG